jgi:myo-inositol 2-dehydrogenase/D-chiro-inositol 1-dehydrogenase
MALRAILILRADQRFAQSTTPFGLKALEIRVKTSMEGWSKVRVETGKPPLRLGLIGCGRVAQQCHLPALRALTSIELVAVADSDSARLGQVADRSGVQRRYGDYRAMLNDGGIDVVAVCAPPEFHAEMGLAVLDAGQHLFLEKPLALTVSDADRLVDRAAATAGKAMTGFNLRWHRLIRHAQTIIAGGDIGTAVTMHTVFTSATAFPAQASTWRRRHDLGGGVLFDLAIHHFDLWRFLMKSDVEEVFARRRCDERGAECVTVSAVMANGVLVTSSFSHGVSDTNEMEICGARGRLSLSCYRFDSLRVRANGAPPGAVRSWAMGAIGALRSAPQAAGQLLHGDDIIASYRMQWGHFIDAIRNDAPVACGFEDARRALRVTLAAAESASRSQPVKVMQAGGAPEQIAASAPLSGTSG